MSAQGSSPRAVIFNAIALGALFLAGSVSTFAQAVGVTLKADKSSISVGERTTLRVLAQVLPDYRERAQQIFSWHIDLIQEFADPVELQFALAERPASDRDPATASAGTLDGNALRGVYDTFGMRPSAGVSAPVELLIVPVVGAREGVASFRVRPGTGPTALSDFLVVGMTPELDLAGGDYSLATATIEVKAPSAESPSLAISLEPAPNGPGGNVTLTFPVAAGLTYVVQYAEALGVTPLWKDLPGAPHNSGRAKDAVSVEQRFYRLVVSGG